MKKESQKWVLVVLFLIFLWSVQQQERLPPKCFQEIEDIEITSISGNYTKVITEDDRVTKYGEVIVEWEPIYGNKIFDDPQELYLYISSPGWGKILNAGAGYPKGIIPVYACDKEFVIERSICHLTSPGHRCYDEYGIAIKSPPIKGMFPPGGISYDEVILRMGEIEG